MGLFAKCPFHSYFGDTKGKEGVTCEGAEEGHNMRLIFNTKEEFKAFYKKYCYTEYAKCPYYKLINQKYKE